jgi:hypothetical protein
VPDLPARGECFLQAAPFDTPRRARHSGRAAKKNVSNHAGIKFTSNGIISNPIYQEVLPRELIATTQQTITQKTIWYLRSDGTLDMQKLLEAFTQFFREHSDAWLEKFDYKEAGPHLLLMAFLQRIINGGGKIHREYALGRKRMDLLVEWPGLQSHGLPVACRP